ncbi:hypothetical protein FGG08_001609 [Glutinoglossum americanum]|uniref:N-acetyltransferase domain-containing protein n=1 Tax=Glutinoglossum americanum TaxID=1670608 RepID=A0A9P8I6G8_9PEZI|nr:hypothetical protein FGG08_001609 [Glutinoglossum americanum]
MSLATNSKTPRIYIHDTTGITLLPHLQALLPNSLPLLRRLQSPHRTRHSRVLASFPPASGTPPKCCAAAYVDRSRAAETEAWIFSSLEVARGGSSEEQWEAEEQIVGLVRGIKRLGVEGCEGDDERGEGSDPDILLVGSVHERVLRVLKSRGLVHAQTGRHVKYVFNVADLPPQPPLPTGFQFTVVEPADYALVLSRTHIPRKPRTLKLLRSIAITPPSSSASSSPQPVSWGFLGLDASLTSLHVEEEYRGLGLAKAMVVKLFREFGADELAHADVEEENKGSRGLCEKGLGGREGWMDYWVWVDLKEL